MDGLNHYFAKDGASHIAHVSCIYCGRVVGRALAQNENDTLAMTEAAAEGKQHLLRCDQKPGYQPSALETWMKTALGAKE